MRGTVKQGFGYFEKREERREERDERREEREERRGKGAEREERKTLPTCSKWKGGMVHKGLDHSEGREKREKGRGK